MSVEASVEVEESIRLIRLSGESNILKRTPRTRRDARTIDIAKHVAEIDICEREKAIWDISFVVTKRKRRMIPIAVCIKSNMIFFMRNMNVILYQILRDEVGEEFLRGNILEYKQARET